MNLRKTVLLAAMVPSLALAAAPPPPGSADAGMPKESPFAEPDRSPPAPGERPAVDLTRAAEKLEGTAVTPPPPGTARAGQAAPDGYVIQKGDTLWDLSARYLESPWQWPRLWSFNPEIENPHWIYPGKPLRFGPPGAAPAAPAEGIAEAADAPPRPEVDDLSRGNIDRVQLLDDEDAVTVGGAARVAGFRARGPAVLRNSFVTPRELDASGTVAAAFEEKMLLTKDDRIYGKFKEPAAVKVGQTFSIYRTEGPIVHPVTRRFFGYRTLVLGSARVTAVEPGKDASLVITYANDSIERGDRIGPAVEQARKPLFTRPNGKSVDGYVVGVQPSIMTGAAEFNVVYLDKGRADGVDVGNTFEVVRSGDPLLEPPDRPLNSPRLPREVIGHLVVFDAQETASSAYVRRSVVELLVGDHVEMRPAPQAPGKQGG